MEPAEDATAHAGVALEHDQAEAEKARARHQQREAEVAALEATLGVGVTGELEALAASLARERTASEDCLAEQRALALEGDLAASRARAAAETATVEASKSAARQRQREEEVVALAAALGPGMSAELEAFVASMNPSPVAARHAPEAPEQGDLSPRGAAAEAAGPSS